MDAVERIRKWMCDHHFDGVVLGRRDNYSFLSQGAENHVLSSTETGVAYYVVQPNSVELIADSSDLERMSKEQDPLKATPILVPWYVSMEGFLKEHIKGKRFASDTGVAETTLIQEQLVEMRMKLSKKEVDTYVQIGQTCAQLVEETCKEACVGQSEWDIANKLKTRCMEQGISPDCVLVGADQRIVDYRHPMPTKNPIKESLMVVLGAQQYGLNISMTRMVYFGQLPDDIKARYEHTAYIFACMQTMMKEGLSYSEYFLKVCDLYEKAGYKDEWKLHHQGGPTGYGCREFIVTPNQSKQLHIGQAYAWNPTICGTKCEETTYMHEKGIWTLTRTDAWPRMIIDTPHGEFEVADILVRP